MHVVSKCMYCVRSEGVCVRVCVWVREKGVRNGSNFHRWTLRLLGLGRFCSVTCPPWRKPPAPAVETLLFLFWSTAAATSSPSEGVLCLCRGGPPLRCWALPPALPLAALYLSGGFRLLHANTCDFIFLKKQNPFRWRSQNRIVKVIVCVHSTLQGNCCCCSCSCCCCVAPGAQISCSLQSVRPDLWNE